MRTLYIMPDTDIARLKAALDLRLLVGETHPINRAGKITCPFHDDAHPSCHIYPNGYKCFGCGSYGDHFSWLKQVRGMPFKEALAYLKACSGALAPVIPRRPKRKVEEGRSFKVVSEAQLSAYCELLTKTEALPKALEQRGLSLADAKRLGIAAEGEDAIFPVYGPSQDILALKRRIYPGQPGNRYHYVTSGHGSPAWCSPNLAQCRDLLVIEGELNGMVSYLALQALQAEVAVMAPAGTSGKLHDRVLSGKRVFIYADGDAAGKRAASRWRKAAQRAGALKVKRLKPLRHDACKLAASCGQLYLASVYLEAMFGRRVRQASKAGRLRHAA